jgi:hypothetical protein
VRQIGTPQTTFGKTPVKITMAQADGLRIAHNTPFTPQPAPSNEVRRALAQAGRSQLPYVLDIWDGKTKVFSVAWGDDDLRVTTFKKGPWTERLKAASLRTG